MRTDFSKPVSKARTAYELLDEVIEVIQEEPKRYNQGTWGTVTSPSNGGPACGTVACVAGWAGILRHGTHALGLASAGLAQLDLGLTVLQKIRLFDGDAIPNVGTPDDYIKAGVAHIRAFQGWHKAQLKNRRLPPVTSSRVLAFLAARFASGSESATARDISAVTNIPVASVRRQIGELRRKGYTIKHNRDGYKLVRA